MLFLVGNLFGGGSGDGGFVAAWIGITLAATFLAVLLGALVKRPILEPLLLGGLLSYPGLGIEILIVGIVWVRRRYARA